MGNTIVENKLVEELVNLGDYLDGRGLHKITDEIDELMKKAKNATKETDGIRKSQTYSAIDYVIGRISNELFKRGLKEEAEKVVALRRLIYEAEKTSFEDDNAAWEESIKNETSGHFPQKPGRKK